MAVLRSVCWNTAERLFKHMKRILSSLIVTCLVFLCTGIVFAADESKLSEEPIDYGEPISVETYYDEEVGDWVTEKSYIAWGNSSAQRGSIDNPLYHKKVKYIPLDGGVNSLEFYAEGMFTWGDSLSVDSADGGHSKLGPLATEGEEEITDGVKSPAIGYDYAYVTYKFRYCTSGNTWHSATVTAKVNRKGSAS